MQLYNQRILKMLTKNRLCLFIFMGFICGAASALQSDFKEMITIDSDKQFADVDNDHVIFTDNVEIHQGTEQETNDRAGSRDNQRGYYPRGICL